MTKEPDDPMRLISELAEEYRISRMTMYRLVRNGEVKSTRIGRAIRIRQSDWDKFLTREQ